MRATWNIAGAMNAYVFNDRAIWMALDNKGDLQLLCQGGAGLLKSYGVMLVNPARFPHAPAEKGQAFIDWSIGLPGQKVMAQNRFAGQQMSCPLALPDVLGAVALIDSMCRH